MASITCESEIIAFGIVGKSPSPGLLRMSSLVVLLVDCLKELWVCLTCCDRPDVAIVGICGDSVANGHLAAVLATKCHAEHEDSIAILCS